MHFDADLAAETAPELVVRREWTPLGHEGHPVLRQVTNDTTTNIHVEVVDGDALQQGCEGGPDNGLKGNPVWWRR